MIWVNFLHIYQPFTQSKEILERIVNESYRPLFRGFFKIPKVKINLNINGGLTELLAKRGYKDVIETIKKLAQTNKLEFTESASFHPILPFLKKKDIIRQIALNSAINKKYFGKIYRPVCFFSPEMAYSFKVAKIVSDLGYKMMILDEISFDGGKNIPPNDSLFTVKNTNNLIIVFRERRVSNCIMSAVVRNKKEFVELIKDEIKKNCYLCTAMDGETFGHHRPGLEKILFKIVAQESPKQIFFSKLPKYFGITKEIAPVKSTWASSGDDIEKGVQFYSWRNPENKVHHLQWRFLNYLTKLSSKKKLGASVQKKLDQALASDQFFWASGEPWWSIEMIEKGAWILLDTLKSIPHLSREELKEGEGYYRDILSIAFWWQRSGKVERLAKRYRETVKIPFKERTLEAGKPEVYFAFLEMMKRKMFEVARKKNYERAILWRDAIWKLETKNDIYDAIHAVDLLRLEVPDPELRKLMDRYKEKYEKIKSGQPEMRRI